MNVTLRSNDLVKELELLAKVVASKPTLPVLANVLIQAEGNGLRLAATDLEIGLVTFCPAGVNQPGITTLPVKHLLDVTRLLTGGASLTLNGTSAKLDCESYRSRIQTYSASDYPAMPSMKDLPTVTLTGLQDAIRRVRFAVSEKDKRYFLNGALLSFVEGGFILAATDGHRLAVTHGAAPAFTHEPVIIPSKTLDKLIEMPGDILMAVGERHLFFVIDGRMLFSRMIDGKFPDYNRIIPRDTDCQALVPHAQLKSALERIVLTAKEVVFKLTAGVMTLFSKSAEIGDAAEQINVQYGGTDTTFTLNGEYLLEFVRVAVGPTLTVTWKSAGTLLFTDNPAYCYCQMPLRNV